MEPVILDIHWALCGQWYTDMQQDIQPCRTQDEDRHEPAESSALAVAEACSGGHRDSGQTAGQQNDHGIQDVAHIAAEVIDATGSWMPCDPWLFLDRVELGRLSATCKKNSVLVAECTPLAAFGRRTESEEQRFSDSEVDFEAEHVVEEPLADNGWPDLSTDQQAAFENNLPFWLQGTEGTTGQRLRIGSWRFFHADAVSSRRVQ